MHVAMMVTWYNPNDENINNISEYLKFVDKLYIVDNSSVNNKKLIKNSKKIEYILNMKNLGIATALNIAANKAIDDGYDFLVTMDQDSFLSKDNYDDMVNYINNNDMTNIGIVSPYHDIETNRRKPTTDVEEVLEVMTSGNFLNLDIYKKVGGFKDWLFIDDVDIEYCLNLNKSGYKVIRLNNVKMNHKLGNTKVYKILNKRFIVSNHNAIRRYYMFRNMYYILEMYKDTFPEYCEFLYHVQKGQIRYVILFEHDKINKLKAMRKGYIDYKNRVVGEYCE